MRYTPSSPSVNSTRLRRSETVKMFFRLSITSLWCVSRPHASHDRLRDAARRLDFFAGLPAELVRVDGQRLADVAPRKNLHRPRRAVHQAVLAEQVRSHQRAGVESRGDRVEIHDFVLDPERVVEPPLGHAPVQRHLPAFEPALELEPRARLRALMAASRRL